MSPSLHSSFSVSFIAITSVIFIHFFVKHVDGTVNYLVPINNGFHQLTLYPFKIPAIHSELFVVKVIEQADGSLAYEITSTPSSKPEQAKEEKGTANNIGPNSPSGAANNQKQTGAANSPTAATTTPLLSASSSSPTSAQKAYEDPVLPSLDEPYTETDDFVWPVKLPSKYPKRPKKPVTPSSSGLPLRLPSTLPSAIIDNATPTVVTGSGSSPPATSSPGSTSSPATSLDLSQSQDPFLS